MRHSPARQSGTAGRGSFSRNRLRVFLAGLLATVAGAGGGGCGGAVEQEGWPDETGVLFAEEEEANGLSTNGLSTNGLSTNGLSTNGLSTNGLSTNGFSQWFNQNPSLARAVMKYVVLCAVPQGQTLSFTNPVTGTTHTWKGGLGLAPGWASGLAATEAEQEVVSACLAAHANKFGVQVPISVLGRDGAGTPIPYTSLELAAFNEEEACFFGNLFDGTGVFSATDGTPLSLRESSVRVCGRSPSESGLDCAPMVYMGTCATLCERAYGNHEPKPYYQRCTYNGKTYRPITTRIRAQDIYRCGDGVCQLTERCGDGRTFDNCQADCGPCAP